MKRKNGFSMIELMVCLAITVVIVVAFTKLIRPNLDFFRRSQLRQQTNVDARKCMDTIKRFLSNAKATTVIISTPGLASPRPNSQIAFTAIDGSSSYIINWSDTPPNTVHVLQTTPPGAGGNTVDTIIAANVTGLMFTMDFRDPAVINVSLQLDTLLDNQGNDSSVYTILQPNQVVRMAHSQ